jgi:cyclase
MTRLKRVHVASATLFALIVLLIGSPVFAQIDLSGDWAVRIQEDQTWRGPGSDLGEYQGIPLSPAGRLRASSWDASINTLPEKQCNPLPADDFTDIGAIRIWKEVDPVTQQVIAWHEYTEWQAQERIIWMDGRPHPSPYAPHTWQGFSTGKWEGNQLTITTTHLKTAPYERVGLLRSDLGSLREHWIRHGDHITFMVFISDPVFLAEPLVRTRDYVLNLTPQIHGYSCIPTNEIAATNQPEGAVPHYLPGKNPFLLDATKHFGVPEMAVRGGPETMYPDFLSKLKNASATRPVDDRQVPQTLPAAPAIPTDLEKVNIEVLPVQGNVYLLVGAGGNTVVQVGDHSVLVVDTQLGPMSSKIVAAIRQITNKPIRYVVNTNSDADHTGGNADIAKAGSQIGGQYAAFLREQDSAPASIIAHENVLKRMSAPTGAQSPVPFAAWPSETFAIPEYKFFNGEGVQIVHEPEAHTDGDSIVFFRRSDVIAAGDIFSTFTYPVIDRKNGGSVNGLIAALNHLIKLSIPKDKQEGGTYIIPGHGRISDQADVVDYRDMVTIVRDRIQDLIKQSMTLEQVKAARPTLDYDPRFGSPDAFIEAIYADLSAGKK